MLAIALGVRPQLNFLFIVSHEHMDIFVNIDEIPRGGILKELEVCDFDKTWSACQ